MNNNNSLIDKSFYESDIEKTLSKQGERILLVETSGLASFTNTQRFYLKCGYEEEARVREFYQAGEDKIIFRKSLIDN